MKLISFFLLPLLFVFNLYILFFQAEWLGIAILENPPLPLGTIVSWISIFILPLFIYQVLPLKKETGFEKRAKTFLKVIVISAAAWGIISWLLSGNWTFNFANKTYFMIWILYSALIIFSTLTVFFISVLRKLFLKK